MESKKKIMVIAWCIVFCWTTAIAFSVEDPAKSAGQLLNQGGSKNLPAVQMIEPGIFKVGGCTIIKERNRVEFPAAINMQEGLLEYLIVGRAGKLHESLLQTQVEPYALQLALLLSGLEGSVNPIAMQGQNAKPEGDAIDISLAWLENGQEKNIHIEQFVLANGQPIPQIPWVFTGSAVVDGLFMAQVEKSIVAVYHDPAALIDHQLESGASDEVWSVNAASVPEIGTEVKVIIEKSK